MDLYIGLSQDSYYMGTYRRSNNIVYITWDIFKTKTHLEKDSIALSSGGYFTSSRSWLIITPPLPIIAPAHFEGIRRRWNVASSPAKMESPSIFFKIKYFEVRKKLFYYWYQHSILMQWHIGSIPYFGAKCYLTCA